MSEPVPSRTDTVVPDPQAAGTARTSGSIANAPGSDPTSAATIERMAERLLFYESFDELIQSNIARSGQLMREAGEKRDEAIAAIAQSRQQVEVERETQRAALTELLDDVMTIQQATERLAHRVSDALEQIEFDLEPVGLHEIGATTGQQTGRLPHGFSTGVSPFQSVAEAVDDEYRLGLLGQQRSGADAMSTVPVPSGIESSSTGLTGSGSDGSRVADGDAGGVTGHPDGPTGNPENDELTADEPAPQDAPEIHVQVEDANDRQERPPGEGAEAAPLESSASTWDHGERVTDTVVDGDLTRVVEPPVEATVEPPVEATVEPDVEVTSAAPIASEIPDVSNEVGDATSTVTVSHEAEEAVPDADPVGTGSTLSFDSEPVGANLTSPDVLGSDEAASPVAEAESDVRAAVSGIGIDAAVSAVDETPSTVASNGTGYEAEPVPGLHLASPDDGVAARPTADVEPVDIDVAPAPVMAPAASTSVVTEQQTTVVLDGVPRAAVALAIQRHILSKPNVLRAEVREYYDHRLTLFVTGHRATTADDLEDWDGSATWERIRASPELLELRMVM